MDEALWSSVRDVLSEETGGSMPAGTSPYPAGPDDPGSGDPSSGDGGPTNLIDYACYFDLTLAPPDGTIVSAADRASATRHLVRRLAAHDRSPPQAKPPRIANFSTDDFSAEELERMHRWWDIEPANRMAMTSASAEDLARARAMIEIAMNHLRDAAPQLHGEVQTIIRDIVASRPGAASLFHYGGASSFALWGALTINVETQREWLQLYRQIVHEAGHNILFAMARDEPLVLDRPDDRRASPVRADPRPLDGIFHAAFVSARESIAFDQLLCRHAAVRCLSDDDAGALEDLLSLSVVAFWDCVEVLRDGGAHLTPLGEAVLADCESYMTANFALEPLAAS